MEGTVASYSGTTLVMNITTTARLGHMEILVDSYAPGDYDRDWFREGNMPVRRINVVTEIAHVRRIERGVLKVG